MPELGDRRSSKSTSCGRITLAAPQCPSSLSLSPFEAGVPPLVSSSSSCGLSQHLQKGQERSGHPQ